MTWGSKDNLLLLGWMAFGLKPPLDLAAAGAGRVFDS